MKNRWTILAVLFTVRTVMGIQFQSVASTSPYLISDLAIDYTRLGVLIGLYNLPGVFLAFPGGLLGKRFGMGLFYSFYYGGMMALTSLAGFSRDLTQNAAAPILFGGMLLIIAIIVLAIFRRIQPRVKLVATG